MNNYYVYENNILIAAQTKLKNALLYYDIGKKVLNKDKKLIEEIQLHFNSSQIHINLITGNNCYIGDNANKVLHFMNKHKFTIQEQFVYLFNILLPEISGVVILENLKRN